MKDNDYLLKELKKIKASLTMLYGYSDELQSNEFLITISRVDKLISHIKGEQNYGKEENY